MQGICNTEGELGDNLDGSVTGKNDYVEEATSAGAMLSYSEDLADIAYNERSKEIITFRGISLRALNEILQGIQNETLAKDVELYVATHDFVGDNENVMKGMTIRLISERSKTVKEGSIPYIEGSILFTPGIDAEKKARKDWTTEDIAEYLILPATQKWEENPYYLDLIDPKDVGNPYQGAFVSQARKCCFKDLVNSLNVCFKKSDPCKQFVWLDIISANQPVLTLPSASLPKDIAAIRKKYIIYGLHEALKVFEKAVLFIDRWDEPAPLQRTWCVWEIYGAIRYQKHLQVIFAPGQENVYLEKLLDGPGEIMKIMADKFDMRNATCFQYEDKVAIDSAVENIVVGGFVKLNMTINKQMRSWLMQITDHALTWVRTQADSELLTPVLCSAAFIFSQQGEYQKALKYYQEGLDLLIAEFGPHSHYVARVLNNIGDIYQQQGAPSKALKKYKKAYNIWVEAFGEINDMVATALSNIGCTMRLLDPHDEEILRYHEQALEIRKATLAKDSYLIGVSINNIASFHHDQGDFSIAMSQYKTSLEILQKTFGPMHPEIAKIKENIGGILQEQGNKDDALQYFVQALQIRQVSLEETHPLIAVSLNSIGMIYKDRGDYTQAKQYFSFALKCLRSGDSPKAAIYDTTLHNLIESHSKCGEFTDALGFAYNLLRSKQDSLERTEQLEIADIMCKIADLEDKLQLTEDALKTLQQGLKILGAEKEKFSAQMNQSLDDKNKLENKLNSAFSQMAKIKLRASENPSKAKSSILITRRKVQEVNPEEIALLSLETGNIYMSRHEYDQAAEQYQLALSARSEAGIRQNDALEGLIHSSIGDAMERLGNKEQAIQHYKVSLAILEETFVDEPQHSRIGALINNIASLNNLLGRFDEAMQGYEKALPIIRHNFGEESTVVSTVYNSMASIFYQQSDFASALDYSRRALSILKDLYGPRNLEVADCFQNLGVICCGMSSWHEALSYFERAEATRIDLAGLNHPLTKHTEKWIQSCRKKLTCIG